MTQIAKRLIDAQELKRAYDLLTTPGQVAEVRALEASRDPNARYKPTLGGYFDNFSDLLREVSTIRTALGIYITLQPCHPQLLHKAKNKLVEQKKGSGTSDKDITRYTWLVIDSDPERVAGISSTDEEHSLALAHSQMILAELESLGWSAPYRGDSGNGSHLGYSIDLAAGEGDLVKRVLEGLATRFDTPGVHVDQTLFNPARLIKLYGTLACKGDDTQERPHRMSRLLEVPEQLQPVPRELLENIAAQAPVAQSHQSYRAQNNGFRPQEGVQEDFTAEKFIDKYSIPVKSSGPYQGGTRYLLEACAWDPSHTDNSACVYQFADGHLGASCSHNSCRGKGWRDFRVVFEPDAYSQKIASGKKKNKTKKEAESGQDGQEETPEKEPSAQTRLMWIAEQAKYIYTTSGTLYARVPVNGHHEIVTINERGSGFRRWLTYRFHTQYGYAPNSDALSQVMSSVQALAEYEGEKAKVYTRIAEKNGCVYLDLCNDKWECIEISSDGWRVITCPPVYFRRPNGMLPLPVPQRGGNLDDLRRLIHAKEEKDYVLIASWLVGTLHPTGPYPVMNLNGERGSTKTFTTKILRDLIDPNEAPTRNAPKDERDAAITAQNNMVIALDNLSSMPLWLSDVLCRIATGSGFATRELYSDDNERIFSSKRPIIMNGIEDGLITQGDLLNRTILVTLEPPKTYLSEEEMNDLFAELHPRILGGLLTVASTALHDRKKIQLEKAPRMADFARWVTAAEPALKWGPGTFMSVYTENQDNASSIITESSPVAKAIIQFMDSHKAGWQGLISELHTELQKYEVYEKAKSAPKTPNKLSGALKRVAPALRIQGIDIQSLPRQTKGSKVAICYVEQPPEYVDTPAKNVDKHPKNVDRLAKNVDKNSLSTYDLEADKEPIDSKNGHIYVDNVDTFASLTDTLSSDLVEKKREEREIPDKEGILSTSPTLSTVEGKTIHSQESDQEEFLI